MERVQYSGLDIIYLVIIDNLDICIKNDAEWLDHIDTDAVSAVCRCLVLLWRHCMMMGGDGSPA